MSDVKDIHEHLTEATRIETENGGTYIEYERPDIPGLERDNALVTIQINIFKNPEYDGFAPVNQPEFLFGVSHLAADGTPSNGEETAVPTHVVLEAALALYMATATQATAPFPRDTAERIHQQLAIHLQDVQESFLMVLHELGGHDSWIEELRNQYDGDVAAMRDAAKTLLRATAAEAGVDPDSEEFDLDTLLDAILPESAQEASKED